MHGADGHSSLVVVVQMHRPLQEPLREQVPVDPLSLNPHGRRTYEGRFAEVAVATLRLDVPETQLPVLRVRQALL
jgi:hypothetical protein